MEKVVIVDDEYLVRDGLCQIVDWAALGLEVVGSAENGALGLELVRELKPDLVISDIRMPVMDGLDMAKTLFDEGADLAVIVYSGYSDFEYARRALDTHVAAFLLKPIEIDELESKVKEVLCLLHENRLNSKKLDQYNKNQTFLERRLMGELFDGTSSAASIAEQLAVLGRSVPPSGALLYCRSRDGVSDKFASDLAEALSAFGDVLTENYGSHCVFVSPCTDEHALVHKTTRVMDAALGDPARYCIAIVPYDGNIAEAHGEARQIAHNRHFSAINSVLTRGSGITKYKKLVRDAIEIIERDFDDKLSVKSVAEILFASESHLMHEFKEQTGKTFVNFLTEYRMLRAEEMLLEGRLRVNEVAFAVGYTDVKYFGQVFKQYVGMTPSEFIRKRVDEDQNA